MYIERFYQLEQAAVVAALEDIAESCMSPEDREDYTIKGIAIGKSRDSQRELLPEEYREEGLLQMASMPNDRMLLNLLSGAGQIYQGEEHFLYQDRFNLPNLLRKNLQTGETLRAALERYGVWGRDDGTWYFWLEYFQNRLKTAVGDNTTWCDPDQGFIDLYQRLFGNTFEKYQK